MANKEQEAVDWFIGRARSEAGYRKNILSNDQRAQDDTVIGKLYFFKYDPKLKKTLPIYDIYPLVFPIERYGDGFLGLNLHYIHPKQRLLLLDKLSEYATNDKYDKTTKLRLSYSLLKSAAKIYELQACIKRYLYSNIESKLSETFKDPITRMSFNIKSYRGIIRSAYFSL